jgi:hypothetical protein
LFRKYLFSLDHKVIGLQYALTSLIFLLIGFGLAIVFSWQLAYPGNAVPLVGSLCGELTAPGGVRVLVVRIVRIVRIVRFVRGVRVVRGVRSVGGVLVLRRSFSAVTPSRVALCFR